MKKALLLLIAIAAMPVAGVIAAQAQTPPTGPHLAPPLPGQPPPNSILRSSALRWTKAPSVSSAKLSHHAIRLFRSKLRRAPSSRRRDADESGSKRHQARGWNHSPMPACSHPHYRGDGQKVTRMSRGFRTPTSATPGSYLRAPPPKCLIGFLSAEWSVPPTPASNDGQILFYFPGLEDSNDVVTIIQPVLGWNSDYASAWGIASWNCCISGTTYEATPQKVNPGDTILGYMMRPAVGETRL